MGNIEVLLQRIQSNFRVVVFTVIAAVLLASSQMFVSAQEVDNVANTLRVTPVRTDIEVQPGQTRVVKTAVTNLTDAPIAVRPVMNDFIAGDEFGTPSLILDEDEFAPTHSLKRFMAPIEQVTIPANESRAIEVTITVPADAQAGGYFGAVRFAPASENTGGQVNMSASVASLILLTVPGDIVEEIDLTEFNIEQGGKSSAYFGSANDLNAAIRFENKGNVQVGPLGKISVQKGDELIYETDFNNKDLRDMILPDSARRWDVPLKNIGSFGKYTVSATFTYGAKNQTIEVVKSFWIIPTGVIIATIVGVLAIIGVIIGFWMFLRGYKRKILKKHSKDSDKE